MFNNWKTTVLGIAIAFGNLLAQGVSLKNAAMSVGIALFGAISKDYNVTGGTKPQ